MTQPPDAAPARARVHGAVARVSASLGPEGITPYIADGRFDRWVRGLVALDPQPGERLAVRADAPPRWVVAVLVELVGPQGRIWVVPAEGRAGVRWRWQCRGLGPTVRATGSAPAGLDGLWCLWGVCPQAGVWGAHLREGGRMVLRWLQGGLETPWLRVERQPARLTVDAAA